MKMKKRFLVILILLVALSLWPRNKTTVLDTDDKEHLVKKEVEQVTNTIKEIEPEKAKDEEIIVEEKEEAANNGSKSTKKTVKITMVDPSKKDYSSLFKTIGKELVGEWRGTTEEYINEDTNFWKFVFSSENIYILTSQDVNHRGYFELEHNMNEQGGYANTSLYLYPDEHTSNEEDFHYKYTFRLAKKDIPEINFSLSDTPFPTFFKVMR